MAYDHKKYQEEYQKNNIKQLTIKLHKIKDADIIDVLETSSESNQSLIKKYFRKGLETNEKNKD